MASSWSSSPESAPRSLVNGPVGFGNRLAAFAIDVLCLYVVMVPLALLGFHGFVVETLLPSLAVIVLWRLYGGTPGKRAVSARIVDARTLGTPSLARLALRYVGYVVSAVPLFLGFAWIAIDRRRQAWHDKIAGTMVIYDDD